MYHACETSFQPPVSTYSDESNNLADAYFEEVKTLLDREFPREKESEDFMKILENIEAQEMCTFSRDRMIERFEMFGCVLAIKACLNKEFMEDQNKLEEDYSRIKDEVMDMIERTVEDIKVREFNSKKKELQQKLIQSERELRQRRLEDGDSNEDEESKEELMSDDLIRESVAEELKKKSKEQRERGNSHSNTWYPEDVATLLYDVVFEEERKSLQASQRFQELKLKKEVLQTKHSEQSSLQKRLDDALESLQAECKEVYNQENQKDRKYLKKVVLHEIYIAKINSIEEEKDLLKGQLKSLEKEKNSNHNHKIAQLEKDNDDLKNKVLKFEELRNFKQQTEEKLKRFTEIETDLKVAKSKLQKAENDLIKEKENVINNEKEYLKKVEENAKRQERLEQKEASVIQLESKLKDDAKILDVKKKETEERLKRKLQEIEENSRITIRKNENTNRHQEKSVEHGRSRSPLEASRRFDESRILPKFESMGDWAVQGEQRPALRDDRRQPRIFSELDSFDQPLTLVERNRPVSRRERGESALDRSRSGNRKRNDVESTSVEMTKQKNELSQLRMDLETERQRVKADKDSNMRTSIALAKEKHEIDVERKRLSYGESGSSAAKKIHPRNTQTIIVAGVGLFLLLVGVYLGMKIPCQNWSLTNFKQN